jgi:hypothetical protein
VKEGLIKQAEDGEDVEKVKVVKEEIVVEDKVVNAPVDAATDADGQEEPP